MIIESINNQKLKLIRKLAKKKTRHKEGLYILEGVRLIQHAIDNGVNFKYILFSTDVFDVNGGRALVKDIYKKEIDYAQVEDYIFEKVSDTVNTQGVIAVIEMNSVVDSYKVKDLNDQCLFIDRIQDPGNLGTIIRTADAAGFKDVFISKGTVDPYNQKVVRATMGSIVNMNIHFVKNSVDTLKKLKDADYKIVVTDLDSNSSYNEVDYNDKSILVVGNEGNGIEKSILGLKDQSVYIPITGSAESLNVAIASGIIMYKMKEVIES